jgi:transglutaminase-like putative cysteine protease
MQISVGLVRLNVLLSAMCTTTATAQTLRQAESHEYVISADHSFVYTSHREITPLTQSALQAVAQMRFNVNGNQTFELIEAYTRKSDGRQVPVSQEDIINQDGAVGPMLSYVDLKVRQVPFKSVAVGDTVAITFRYTQSRHYLGDGFSTSYAIAPSGAEVTSETTIRHPTSMPVIHAEQQFNYDESLVGETVVRRWSGHFQIPQSTEQNVADLTSRLPRWSFSTFRSYEEIGAAFYDGAGPLLEVTPAIANLAEDITRGKTEHRQQAEAIFDWVTVNIRYLAVLLGSGRVVPNAPETVIANRYGDCKDVATLMGALLAAKGIASEYALINTNPVYRLDTSPLTGSFNHVILYLPEFDLYADPTSSLSFVGRLPRADLGKPVLRLSKQGMIEARTPVGTTDDNVAHIFTHLRIEPDEIVHGETQVEGSGEFAQMLQRFARQSEGKSAQVALDAIGKQLNIIGDYGLDMPPPTSRAEPYRMTATWTSDKPQQLVASGMHVPPGLTPFTVNVGHFFGPVTRNRAYDANCLPGRISQEVRIELPQGIALKNLPDPARARAMDFEFKREWSLQDQTIVEQSELRSTHAGATCSPDVIRAVADAIDEIRNAVAPLLQFARRDNSRP